jgi:hypothetical protein
VPCRAAFTWSGTAASAVDLTPRHWLVQGFDGLYPWDFSEAYAISDDGHIVGEGGDSGFHNGHGDPSFTHALLWTAPISVSAVDLNPEGYDTFRARGVWGDSQVGYGSGTVTDSASHALLWHGTPESVVDLHPAGFDTSFASGVWGASQVGYGNGPGGGFNYHALLWHGTAESVIDLNPAGFDYTTASAVSGASQVGEGYGPATAGKRHAILWNGTPESVHDLHQYLSGLGPAFVSSTATAIGDSGWIVGYATDAQSNSYAVLWMPVPDTDVPGDYNDNGAVDAADYVLWRTGDNNLSNEVATIGTNTPQDYTEWRVRFGNPAASATTLANAVPEPASGALFLLILAMLHFARVRYASRLRLRLSTANS